jgi:hypothetical protein
MTDPYTLYYQRQAAGTYAGDYRAVSQKGDGIGSFLGGLFRRMLPLISGGFKAIGKEGLATGVNLLKDTLNGRTFKDSVRDRVTEAGRNLTDKAAKKMSSMVGDGYKSKKRKRVSQSTTRSKKRRLSKKGRSKSDIFGEY